MYGTLWIPLKRPVPEISKIAKFNKRGKRYRRHQAWGWEWGTFVCNPRRYLPNQIERSINRTQSFQTILITLRGLSNTDKLNRSIGPEETFPSPCEQRSLRSSSKSWDEEERKCETGDLLAHGTFPCEGRKLFGGSEIFQRRS